VSLAQGCVLLSESEGQSLTSPSVNTQRPCFVYMVECSDGTLYTGWTTDVTRRVKMHNAGRGGRYTPSTATRSAWSAQSHSPTGVRPRTP
jgi:hypothetical protein